MEDQPLVQRLARPARPEAQDFAQEAPTQEPMKLLKTCFFSSYQQQSKPTWSAQALGATCTCWRNSFSRARCTRPHCRIVGCPSEGGKDIRVVPSLGTLRDLFRGNLGRCRAISVNCVNTLGTNENGLFGNVEKTAESPFGCLSPARLPVHRDQTLRRRRCEAAGNVACRPILTSAARFSARMAIMFRVK